MPKLSKRSEGRIGTPARKLQKLIANIPRESTNNTIGRQGVQRSPRAAPHSSMGLLDLNGSSVTHAITPQNYKKISRANGRKRNSLLSSRSSSESDDSQSQQSCSGELAGHDHNPNQPIPPSEYPSMPTPPVFQDAVAIPPPVERPAGGYLPFLSQFDDGINPIHHNLVYQEPLPLLPQPAQDVQYPHFDAFNDNSLIYGPSTIQPTADPLSFDWSGSTPSSQTHSNHGWHDPNSPPLSYDFSSYDAYPMLSLSASALSSFSQQPPTDKHRVYSQFLDIGHYNNIPQIQQPFYEDYGRF